MSIRGQSGASFFNHFMGGIAVTIGVAWALTFAGYLKRQGKAEDCREWQAPMPSTWPQPQMRSQSSGIGIAGERRYFDEPDGQGGYNYFGVDTVLVGWPFLAMASERWTEDTTSHSPIGSGLDAYWRQGLCDANAIDWSSALPERRLPIRPMPIGFALNTVVFGTSSWLVCSGFTAWRAAIRRRLQRCRRCGYPIIGPQCPECGIGSDDPVQPTR